jgi:hypothetical protein
VRLISCLQPCAGCLAIDDLAMLALAEAEFKPGLKSLCLQGIGRLPRDNECFFKSEIRKSRTPERQLRLNSS